MKYLYQPYFKEYFIEVINTLPNKQNWDLNGESLDEYLEWFCWKIMNNKNREVCGLSKSGYISYLRHKKINIIDEI